RFSRLSASEVRLARSAVVAEPGYFLKHGVVGDRVLAGKVPKLSVRRVDGDRIRVVGILRFCDENGGESPPSVWSKRAACTRRSKCVLVVRLADHGAVSVFTK